MYKIFDTQNGVTKRYIVSDRSPNLWDEEWEVGFITSSGGFNNSSSYIRSKNYTEIESNKSYYFYCRSSSDGAICWYDENYNFISRVYSGINRIYVSPNNARYLKLFAYESGYNKDVCLNVSNPAINGNYYPYGKNRMLIGG